MTEAKYTMGIVSFLRDHGVLTFKHCDRFTPSIPDVSATCCGFTTWLEMKYITRGESFFGRVHRDKLQYHHMSLLATLGRAFYVIGRGPETYVIPTAQLFSETTIANSTGVEDPMLMHVLFKGTGFTCFPTNNLFPLLEIVRYVPVA